MSKLRSFWSFEDFEVWKSPSLEVWGCMLQRLLHLDWDKFARLQDI